MIPYSVQCSYLNENERIDLPIIRRLRGSRSNGITSSFHTLQNFLDVSAFSNFRHIGLAALLKAVMSKPLGRGVPGIV